MAPRTTAFEFPGTIELSFEKLAVAIQSEVSVTKGARKSYLIELLELVKAHPRLIQGIAPEAVEEYRAVVDDLMAYLFPPALSKNELKIASAPWKFAPFYTSERLHGLLENTPEEFSGVFSKFDPDQLYISACSAILGMYYGYQVIGARPFFLELKDKTTQTSKHYRMAFNVDFVSIKPTSSAKQITKEDYHQLIDNYHDVELWKEKFPPNSWVFSGFNLVNMLDLSRDWNIKRIEEDLLNGGPNAMQSIQHHMAALLGIPDLEMSFISLEGEGMLKTLYDHQESIMLGHENSKTCDQVFCSNTLKDIIEKHKPLGIPNIDRFGEQTNNQLAENIKTKGLKSYFVAPVVHLGECIGLLELGSKKKGVLNATTSIILSEVIPELAAAGARFQQERSNRIEAIIQEEFTSIHPSVKWRFVQEAQTQILAEEYDERHLFDDLVFEGVYPLYGQLDIRGSSTIRHEAVRSDLLTQLENAEEIIRKIMEELASSKLENILNDIKEYRDELESKNNSVSEHKVLRYLEQQVEPIMIKLQKEYPKWNADVSKYLRAIKNEFDISYTEHRKFDNSVNSLNSFLAAYLDEKQENAQSIHPHYFERHNTDGIEFNMFAGKSIAPKLEFSDLVVKNLRLWQLLVMVEMEWEYSRYKKTLDFPLDIASHILVYDEPLAIHFRLDEKRFDVAGAYNVRYEIIKKRLDKARIKGTNERITQPQKMVIIYTSQAVEDEYLAYVKGLQKRQYFEQGEPEIVEVEDLQGVHGLKALRIGIQYPETS